VPGFAGRVKPDVILQEFPESEGVAYVRGNFALPSPDHPDYPALVVAFTLLDDVLFEIVRTKNGACYSAWSHVHGFTAGYGSLVVYRTSVPGAVKRMIDESIGVLLKGQCLSGRVSASAEGKSGIGGSAEEAPAGVVVPKVQAGGSFVPIAEALPYYKRQFVTSFYEGQQTNLQVADEIASSVVYRGDYRSWLLFLDRVNAVAPADVVRVARQYLRDNPVLWVVVGSRDLLDGVKREDYLRFTGE
jgi:zinc protease